MFSDTAKEMTYFFRPYKKIRSMTDSFKVVYHSSIVAFKKFWLLEFARVNDFNPRVIFAVG